MSSGSISVDRLAATVVQTLRDYRDSTADITEEAAKQTAKETVQEVRKNIDASGIKSHRGNKSYARQIATKENRYMKGRYAYGRVVYVKDPDHRLTHLLEKGHDIVRNGRRVGSAAAFPHWAGAEEFAEERLEELIRQGIERGG